MGQNNEQDPVTRTVAEMQELAAQILDTQAETGWEEDNPAVTWTDQTSGLSYSLRKGFMGDVVVLEAQDQENWDDGSTFKAGHSGLTIGSNENIPAASFQQRFEVVIAAMRAKLAAEKPAP